MNINATDINAAVNEDLMSVELLANPVRKLDAISIVSSSVSSRKNKRTKSKQIDIDEYDDDDNSSVVSSVATTSTSTTSSYVSDRKNKNKSPASVLSSSASSIISDVSNLSKLKNMRKAETINMKRELLYRFDRLEKKGVRLPKRFTMASGLDEMQAEYERLKKDREVDVSVQFQRRALMAFVSGVEFLNSKFDPFDVKLSGWSENVNDNIHDFDDVFEDLYEKYKGKGTMAPELKLMMSLTGSAFMFHLTNTMFKSNLPGIHEEPSQGKRRGGGGGGGGGGGILSNMFGGMMRSLFNGGGGGGGGGDEGNNTPQFDTSRVRKGSMNGPDIDNIIDDIDIASILKNDRIDVTSTISESEISERSSIKSSFAAKKGGKRGVRKTMNIL